MPLRCTGDAELGSESASSPPRWGVMCPRGRDPPRRSSVFPTSVGCEGGQLFCRKHTPSSSYSTKHYSVLLGREFADVILSSGSSELIKTEIPVEGSLIRWRPFGRGARFSPESGFTGSAVLVGFRLLGCFLHCMLLGAVVPTVCPVASSSSASAQFFVLCVLVTLLL